VRRITLAALASCSVLVGASACQDPGATPPVASGALADSADQIMFGVSVTLTDRGIRRADLEADTAYTYEDNTRTELRRVETTFFTETGAKNGTLTARQGTYDVRLGSMEARGDVVVIGEDGRRLETPHLRFDPARNEISSDSAFVLTEPTRKLSGIGFVADPNLNNVRVLANAKASGSGLTITQP
jgi:LPS export ABC transporter protein LptC